MAIPISKTRRVVRWRVTLVILISVIALAYTEGVLLSGQPTGAETTVAYTTATTETSTQTESTVQTSNQTEVSSTTSTATINPAVSSSGIAKMNRTTLDELVNSTQFSFSLSTTALPYLVVTDNLTGKALGLVYLTTDVALSASYGYDGPIGVLVYVNTTGTIEGVSLWSIFDSYGVFGTEIMGSTSWYTSPVLHSYLNSFVNRSVFQPLQVGNDIQGITSATYTSTGIASGIRVGGRAVVNDYQATVEAQTGPGEIAVVLAVLGSMNPKSATTLAALLVLFVGAGAAFWRGKEWAKYSVFIASIMLVGLYAGRMVSISDLPIFLTRYFPPIGTDPFWYLLYGGVLVTSLLLGRLYCGYLCPFGAVTELLAKVSPLKLKMPARIQTRLFYLKYAVLAICVVLVFAAINGIAAPTGFLVVEPFSALFLSVGGTAAFVFLGGVLVASVFFDRFYCSYICPAGAGLSVLGSFRILEIRRWPECTGCKVCEIGCPTGAISHGRISTFECMNCRKCETNYLNSAICPHFASGRINATRSS